MPNNLDYEAFHSGDGEGERNVLKQQGKGQGSEKENNFTVLPVRKIKASSILVKSNETVELLLAHVGKQAR